MAGTPRAGNRAQSELDDGGRWQDGRIGATVARARVARGQEAGWSLGELGGKRRRARRGVLEKREEPSASEQRGGSEGATQGGSARAPATMEASAVG